MRGRTTYGEYQKIEETDDFAPDKPGWTTYAEVYADIQPLNGRELLEAQQLESVVTHKIETEFVRGINSAMRFVAGERKFEITSVINVNDSNRSLELLCTEKA